MGCFGENECRKKGNERRRKGGLGEMYAEKRKMNAGNDISHFDKKNQRRPQRETR